MSFKAALRAAKLPERTVPVCLQLDLQDEFEQAERELQTAVQRPRDSLAAGAPAELSQRVKALEEEMRAHTYDFRLRALPRPAWKALLADHPPRKAEDGSVDERDKYIGVNVDTFFVSLIRASVVEPAELDDDDWSLLLDEKLTDRQFDQLSDAAWSLNRRDVDIPFSHAASRILAASATE